MNVVNLILYDWKSCLLSYELNCIELLIMVFMFCSIMKSGNYNHWILDSEHSHKLSLRTLLQHIPYITTFSFSFQVFFWYFSLLKMTKNIILSSGAWDEVHRQHARKRGLGPRAALAPGRLPVRGIPGGGRGGQDPGRLYEVNHCFSLWNSCFRIRGEFCTPIKKRNPENHEESTGWSEKHYFLTWLRTVN